MTVWLHHRAVQERYGYSRNSIDRLCGQGHLPPPSHPLSPRTPMWSAAVLDAWDNASEGEREAIRATWPQAQKKVTEARERLRERGERGRAAQRAKREAAAKRQRRKRKHQRRRASAVEAHIAS